MVFTKFSDNRELYDNVFDEFEKWQVTHASSSPLQKAKHVNSRKQMLRQNSSPEDPCKGGSQGRFRRQFSRRRRLAQRRSIKRKPKLRRRKRL